MIACLVIISGCTTPPVKTQNVPYQENLKTKCPVNLPRLNGTNGRAAAELLIQWIDIYSTCAARHNQLIDEINLREKKA
nr:hypothetical protein [Pantoea vagans]